MTSDRRLEGDETVDLSLGNLSDDLDSQVSITDSTHTATITDDETGTINFAADAATAEASDPTQNATLTIGSTGTGTIGLDVTLTVDATDATGGSATSVTDYAAYGTQTLTFSTGDGAAISSSSATLDIDDDQRLEGDETVNLTFAGTLSSDLDGQVSEGDTTHTVTIEDNEIGVVDFTADQSNDESIDPTVDAVLLIMGFGTGTVGLDTSFSVTASNAGTGSEEPADLSTTFGTPVLTFATGDGATIDSSSATLDVNDDRRLEGDETVNLTFAGTLSNDLDGQVTENDTTLTVTIVDNEIGVVDFTADRSNDESIDPTVNAVLLIMGFGTGTVGLDTSITVTASNAGTGSAEAADLSTAFGTPVLTFAIGDGATIDSSSATLDVNDDQLLEGDETVDLRIGDLSSTLDGQVSLGDTTHTTTIEDNETAVIDITATGIIDEAGGTQNIGLTLTTTDGDGGIATIAAGVTLTVDISDVFSGIAISGTDYSPVAAPARITFVAGDTNGTERSVPFTPINDRLVEGDESFSLMLDNLQSNRGGSDLDGRASLGNTWNTSTIDDDDTAVLDLSATNTLSEEAGAQTIEVTLTLAGSGTGLPALAVEVSVDVTDIGGGSATSVNDFAAIGTQTLTFPVGDGSGTVRHVVVDVNDDNVVELDETINLVLGNLNDDQDGQIWLGHTSNVTTITNIDSATISIDDVSLDEGNSGTTAFTFTVTLDAEVDANVVVDFATATISNEAEDETGLNSGTFDGDDFASKSGSVTFNANGGVNQTRTVTIDINGDLVVEFDEDFIVDLSNIQAVGRDVTFADNQGTGTIVNDDIAIMHITDVVVQEGDLGVSPFVFNIDLDKIVGRNFSVDYATEDVSATVGNDYTSLSGTLSFAAGDTSATLIVDVAGDGRIEENESFILRFSNLSDAGVAFAGGGPSMGGVATVTNDDFAQQLITTSSLTVNTGGSPNAITVTDLDSGQTLAVTPFAANFQGGSNVTTGDFNFDGRADIIAAAKAGGGPHVQVFNANGAFLFEFMAYDVNFRGGVNVAAADFNRDGVADILTGPGAGGGPHVKVFDGTNPQNLLFDQFVYTSTFLGGVNVAAGDVTGDGTPDIIVGPGSGGGPNVKVFDGVTGSIVHDFFAYDPTFAGGVLVGSGDFNGDRYADIVTGAGPGGGPHVVVFSGQDRSVLQSFFAYDPAFRGGVAVTAADLDGDGVDDVIVGPSDGSTGVGRQVIDGETGAVIRSITPTQLGTGPITTSSSAMTPNGNISPYVVNTPTDVALRAGKLLNWTVPTNTFFDPNVSDTLTLSAYSGNGDPLPTWLSFDSGTNTFSGAPGSGDVNITNVRIVADDGNFGTSNTLFNINVSTASNPVKPSVTSPAANGTVTELTPTFEWTDDPNVAMFDLSVVELSTNNQVIRQKTLTTNSFTATINMAEGDYDVRVRGKNLAGVYSPWNAPHTVTLDINRPAKPVPLTPTGTINDATPTFTWTQDVNTDNVEISIVDTSTGTEVFRQKNITGTSFTIPDTNVLAADGYHFNMQAFNQLNERSGWTSSISFTVALGVPTTAPQITSTMAATTTDATPTFAWRSVVNATRYNLVVTDTATSTVIINEVGLSTTSFTPSSPIVDGTYSVVVTGTNEVGTAGPSSAALTFTIDAAQPARPVIVAPGATTPNARPTFAWTPGANIVEYQLWLAERATPSVAFVRLTGLTTTIATATKDLPPGDYSVWIKGTNVNGTHNWSLEHQFTVNFDVVALDTESTESDAGRIAASAADGDPHTDAEPPVLSASGQLLAMHVLGRAVEQLVVLPTPDAAVDPTPTDAPADAETDAVHQPSPINTRRTSESSQAADLESLGILLANADAPTDADDFFAQDDLITEIMG
ncbi:MAG: putative Ig domain-containing protein [Planctomycetota bacterium]|nr:putative Ig domain-containing protein [Planctomycetota bacterium]